MPVVQILHLMYIFMYSTVWSIFVLFLFCTYARRYAARLLCELLLEDLVAWMGGLLQACPGGLLCVVHMVGSLM